MLSLLVMFAWRVQNAVPLPCCTLTIPPRLNPELETGVANPKVDKKSLRTWKWIDTHQWMILRRSCVTNSLSTLKAVKLNLVTYFPGHGMKGKREKINRDEQLAVMYEKHKKKKRILLWLKCMPKSKKRANTLRRCPTG